VQGTGGFMWRWGMVLALLPGVVWAEDWQVLAGPEITAALTARVVQYEGGAVQNFFADGRTLYEAPAPSWGHWRVQGAQYCSVWLPSDRWTCYEVAQRGLEIRFGSGAEAAIGQYVDLH
jgi:hypothetical protein